MRAITHHHTGSTRPSCRTNLDRVLALPALPELQPRSPLVRTGEPTRRSSGPERPSPRREPDRPRWSAIADPTKKRTGGGVMSPRRPSPPTADATPPTARTHDASNCAIASTSASTRVARRTSARVRWISNFGRRPVERQIDLAGEALPDRKTRIRSFVVAVLVRVISTTGPLFCA